MGRFPYLPFRLKEVWLPGGYTLFTPDIFAGIRYPFRAAGLCCALWLCFFCLFELTQATTATAAASSQAASVAAKRTLPVPDKPALAPLSASGRQLALRQKGPRRQATSRPASPKKDARKGLDGFTDNPFGLEHRDKARVRNARTSGGTLTSSSPAKEGEQKAKVTITGQKPSYEKDRLTPRHSTFSGGPDTLPHMDMEPPPEVSVTYKVSERTSTRVTLNQQDRESPLYRPVEKEDGINAAGVYMHVDMEDNVQLRLGGEYRELDDSRRSQDEGVATGASIGLLWTF